MPKGTKRRAAAAGGMTPRWRARLGSPVGSDGGLYCAPYHARGVLRVDPQSQSIPLLPLPEGCDATQSGKWLGSLVGSDGGLLRASMGPGVLRVDPQSQSTSLLPLPEGCDAANSNGMAAWSRGATAASARLNAPDACCGWIRSRSPLLLLLRKDATPRADQ